MGWRSGSNEPRGRNALDHLSEEQIATARTALDALRKELVQSIASSYEAAKPVDLDQPIGRLSRMDAIQNQQMAQANRGSLEERLGLVMAAIARLESGSYGRCGGCRRPVAWPRLEAIPEVVLCLACQESYEGR